MKKNTKGFTLAEVLIVVSVIAVLVAISIPIFTTQLHKSRVDYMTTGEKNSKVPADAGDAHPDFDFKTITFLDGQKLKLKTGFYKINFDKDTGYSIEYACESHHDQCNLSLPVK